MYRTVFKNRNLNFIHYAVMHINNTERILSLQSIIISKIAFYNQQATSAGKNTSSELSRKHVVKSTCSSRAQTYTCSDCAEQSQINLRLLQHERIKHETVLYCNVVYSIFGCKRMGIGGSTVPESYRS